MIWDYGKINPNINTYMKRDGWGAYKLRQSMIERLGRGVDYSGYTFRDPGFTSSFIGPGTLNRELAMQDGPMPAGSHDVSYWHQDGSYGQETNTTYVAMWSNNGPTEVMLPDGSVYRPHMRHLMVIDNLLCKHRTGRYKFNPDTRFFGRIVFTDTREFVPDPAKLVVG